MIRATCPQCATAHDFFGGLAGMTVRCKHCGNWLQVPSPTTTLAEPATAITASAPAITTPAPATAIMTASLQPEPILLPNDEQAIKDAIAEEPNWSVLPLPEMEETAKRVRDSWCVNCGTRNQISSAPDTTPCRKCGRPIGTPASGVPTDASMDIRIPFRRRAELAGAGRRVFGYLIDHLLLYTPGLLLAPLRAQFPGDAVTFLILAAVCLLFVVQVYLLSAEGQTIAKKLLGMRIVRAADGANPGFVHTVLIREFAGGFLYSLPVLGLFLLLISFVKLFGGERRAIHDSLAGTIVVLD